jgi:hypothetical protein
MQDKPTQTNLPSFTFKEQQKHSWLSLLNLFLRHSSSANHKQMTY